MFDAVCLSTSGLVLVTFGSWFVWRQQHRRADTRAGWGSIAIGLGQLLHGIGSLPGDRQPLGLILALCSAASTLGGAVLVVRASEALRKGRGSGKRRKLPPLYP